MNEPRFYEFQIKKDKNIWKLENGQVHFTGLPSNLSDIEKRKQVLDQEAITALPNGNLLISSEGDGNKKPRIPPRIFEVKTSGEWVRDVLLPAIVMPEPTGQQKQGVGNNFAFEAMTTSPKGENLYFVSERPLLQDVDFKSEKNHFRFFQMKFKDDHFESPTEKYLEGPAAPVGNGIPVVQGFSEMTWVSDHQFLILDRTLKVLGGHTLSFECRLLEVELLESSATAKIQKIHPLKRGTEDLGNCEGMAFGPPTGEYKQTLWIINDNNFSASEDTVLYFFGVKN